MQADLLAIENIMNLEKTKDLLCFTIDDREKDKMPSEITNFIEKEIVLTGFFGQLTL